MTLLTCAHGNGRLYGNSLTEVATDTRHGRPVFLAPLLLSDKPEPASENSFTNLRRPRSTSG